MARIRIAHECAGTLAAAERLWFDLERWPSFIDGFARVVRCEGDWPQAGSRLEWDSTPNGRGRVTETVLAYEPGAGQSSEVEDPAIAGTQRVSFEALDEGVGVALELELDYRLTKRGPLQPVLDLLFIRRAQRDSLGRTLERFARELATDVALRD
jgi:Polyketide cyclase / dehydrase and lipid transport